MSNPMAVNLTELSQARGNYTSSYFLANCNSAFSGQEIRISWDDFSNAVDQFIANNKVAANSVALRFVYCFDATGTSLYYRLQILTMVPDPNEQGYYNLVKNPCDWYVLDANGMNTTTDTGLSDAAYMDNFYYCASSPCTAAGSQKLASAANIYPQNITFPWLDEVYQMYLDNNSPTGGSIGFIAGSFQEDAAAPVTYPQSLIIYLTDQSGNMLVDDSATADFHGKAANFGSLCPNDCNEYVSPV